MASNEVVLFTVGTRGDILPFVALGQALRKRGRPVTLLANADHQALALAHDLDFISVSAPDWPQINRDEGAFWRQVVVPSYQTIFDILKDKCLGHNRPLLVAREGSWGIRFSVEKLGLPIIRVALQPCAIQEMAYPVPPEVVAILNAFRRKIGLTERQAFYGNADADQPTLSLFPAWFGTPQSHLAQAGTCVGFPFLPDNPAGLSAPVAVFLQKYPGPVVFSSGTGVTDIFRSRKAAIDFCRQSGMAVMFLSLHAGESTSDMPENFGGFDYGDHGLLLRSAALMVHNGGIGTTAQCLRRGVPQLIVPRVYDQPDNAGRVEAHGLGLSIPFEEMTGDRLYAAYLKLTADPELGGRIAAAARAIQSVDSVSDAVDYIDAFDLTHIPAFSQQNPVQETPARETAGRAHGTH